MPSPTFLALPPAAQAQRRALLCRARYGSLLVFQSILHMRSQDSNLWQT
jgi:hypothetical protein